jgi:hypothetical protein
VEVKERPMDGELQYLALLLIDHQIWLDEASHWTNSREVSRGCYFIGVV